MCNSYLSSSSASPNPGGVGTVEHHDSTDSAEDSRNHSVNSALKTPAQYTNNLASSARTTPGTALFGTPPTAAYKQQPASNRGLIFTSIYLVLCSLL
jgi:hypothetical protein